MKICPRCQTTYPKEEEQFCTVDGVRLVDEEELERAGRDTMIGREIGGRYSITGIIGRGAMGTVYKAMQRGIDRTVAIKVLHGELTRRDDLVERFRREAQAASMLQSPYTVTLYDFGQDEDGTFYLVMEMLQGEPLGARIKSAGQMPWTEALEIAGQVANSLMEAHDKGIVHRDLKPDNVFLASVEGGRERAKVLDFGIARLTQTDRGAESTLTQTGAVFGTPHYMSPEQAQGLRCDGRSDLYSLGIVLYEMLAGRRPFDATRLMLVIGQHVSTPPPPLREVGTDSDIPEAVENFVMELLAKEPEGRPQTAHEVMNRTDSLLGREPGAAGLDRPSLPRAELRTSAVSVKPVPSAEETKAEPLGQQSREIDEAPAVVEEPAPTPAELLPETPKPAREGTRSRWPLILGGVTVIAVTLVAMIVVGSGIGATATDPPAEPHAQVTRSADAEPVSDSADSMEEATQPATINLSVSAEPDSARISIDDIAVKGNPFESRFPRDGAQHRVSATAEGHHKQATFVLFDRDRSVEIQLRPLEAADDSDEERRPRERDDGRRDPANSVEPSAEERPEKAHRPRPNPPQIDETNPYAN